MSAQPLPRRSETPPEFFVDRSLGRHMVPEALRELGFVVHTMADVYPNGEDEDVPGIPGGSKMRTEQAGLR
jgi:hypothetical protein